MRDCRVCSGLLLAVLCGLDLLGSRMGPHRPVAGGQPQANLVTPITKHS